MSTDDAYIVHIALIGDANCGKTSLIKALIDRQFTQSLKPTLFDHYVTRIIVNGVDYELQIWDCGG